MKYNVQSRSDKKKLNTCLLNCTRNDIYDYLFLSQESLCNRRLAIYRQESALRESAATSTLSTIAPVISTASTTVDNMRKRTAPTPTVAFIDSTTVVFRADVSTRRPAVSTSKAIIKDEQKIPAVLHGVFDDDQPIPSTSKSFATTIPTSSTATASATAKIAAQLLNPIKSTAPVTEDIKMSTFGGDILDADSDSFDDEGSVEENFYDEVAADHVSEDPVVPVLVDQIVPGLSVPADETTADVVLTGLENENYLDPTALICHHTTVDKCPILVNGLVYGIVALLHLLSAVIFGLKSGGYFAKL